ncbi:unnamed protein product [Prunus armeniaca]
MSDMEDVLDRQERERRARMRRRAASKRAQRELDEQLGVAVAMLEEENQSRRGSQEGRASDVDRHRHCRENCAGDLGLLPKQKFTVVIRMLAYGSSADQWKICTPWTTCADLRPGTCNGFYKKAESRGFPGMIGSIDYMHWQWKNCSSAWQGDYGNRKGQKSIILDAVAGFDTWVWHAFFGVAGSQNDLNVLGQSPVFNDILRGECPNITYQVNNTVYQNGYYLADGIYLRWTTFVKLIPHPQSQKEKFFAAYQEGYRKDVDRCFGILQARWAIIKGAARLFDKEVLRSIMMTCIIHHNMIVEDEYDYDVDEVYEPDPMNTTLTRIYEKPMGPNGEPVQHDPLVTDGTFMHRMIERYTEMQSSYIHEHRQVDLMEHLWAVKGNEGQ